MEAGEPLPLLSPHAMLSTFPTVALDSAGIADVRCGRMTAVDHGLSGDSRLRLVHQEQPEWLVAIGEVVDDNWVRPRRVRPVTA